MYFLVSPGTKDVRGFHGHMSYVYKLYTKVNETQADAATKQQDVFQFQQHLFRTHSVRENQV